MRAHVEAFQASTNLLAEFILGCLSQDLFSDVFRHKAGHDGAVKDMRPLAITREMRLSADIWWA